MSSLLLQIIIKQLNHYIKSVEDSPQDTTFDPVILGNMAKTRIAGGAGDDDGLEERIVVSLVNVAEEAALKNKPATKQVGSQIYELQPPVYINLYLLFAANFNEYSSAIEYLFRVIEFFQSKKIFKFKNAPLASVDPNQGVSQGEIEICLDLHTLSFEQLNDLWGSLGGKQLPFVMYRARLIPIQMELPMARTGMITEVDLTTQGMMG
ncbi:uncharacterized protein DUF4255 [Nitrosomonas nitrosa]|uniref:DUF4255 domain-containing protein n=1 Tax=Nitrosomonas nitrosa TaxID=52442 RepID=UPI000D2FBEA6|nr:DUF4255 domain-containing protein [Nitrosomonas nitrosa]PTQ91907.1 uncharacterized protein DUF4255 [Nitrosomonas nitrosa]